MTVAIKAWRTFRTFLIFFSSGPGKRKEASEQVAGFFFLEGGGVSEEEGGGGRCHEDVCKEEGGGANFFFSSGPKCPPRKALSTINRASVPVTGGVRSPYGAIGPPCGGDPFPTGLF